MPSGTGSYTHCTQDRGRSLLRCSWAVLFCYFSGGEEALACNTTSHRMQTSMYYVHRIWNTPLSLSSCSDWIYQWSWSCQCQKSRTGRTPENARQNTRILTIKKCSILLSIHSVRWFATDFSRSSYSSRWYSWHYRSDSTHSHSVRINELS